MQVMFVPQPIQLVETLEFAFGLHASRQLSAPEGKKMGLHVPLEQSPYLVAYMGWPRDEKKRNEWIAAIEGAAQSITENKDAKNAPILVRYLAGPALEAKAKEHEEIEDAWNAVADVYQRLVDLATEEGMKLKGGPSIAKAIDLCQFDKQYSRAQLERFWSQYKDVAHLIAAAAFLTSSGPHAGSIFSAAWISPDAVIGVADGLEMFGLIQRSHGNHDTFLPSQTTWRLPDHCCKKKPFVVRRRLSDAQRQFLESRKARKQYISKP